MSEAMKLINKILIVISSCVGLFSSIVVSSVLVNAVSPLPPSEITYSSLLCDNTGNCPTWTYCGLLRTTCMPCVRCGTHSPDSLTSNLCAYPARCLQSARSLSTTAFYTCPRLAVVNGRPCRGVCQPHAVFDGGSPLGTHCLLQCDDVMVNMTISCRWNMSISAAVWNESLPDGFVLSNDSTTRFTNSTTSASTSPAGATKTVDWANDLSHFTAVIVSTSVLLVGLLLVVTLIVSRTFHCKQLCVKVKASLRPSSQLTIKLGGEHEDVTDSAVSPLRQTHFGVENEFHSTENVVSLPLSMVVADPSESSGLWTQPTESMMESINESIAESNEFDCRQLPLPVESEYDDDNTGATSWLVLERGDGNNNFNDTQPKTVSIYRNDDDVTYDLGSMSSSAIATADLAERQLLT